MFALQRLFFDPNQNHIFKTWMYEPGNCTNSSSIKKALNQTKNNFSEYVFLWIEPVQDRQELSLKL